MKPRTLKLAKDYKGNIWMSKMHTHAFPVSLYLSLSLSASLATRERQTNTMRIHLVFQTKIVSLRITKNKLVLRMPGVEENVSSYNSETSQNDESTLESDLEVSYEVKHALQHMVQHSHFQLFTTEKQKLMFIQKPDTIFIAALFITAQLKTT